MARIIPLKREPKLSADDLSGIDMLVKVLRTLRPIDWDASINDEGDLYVHIRSPSGLMNLFIQSDGKGGWESVSEGSYPFPTIRDKSLGKVAGILAAHQAAALAHRAGRAADIVSPVKVAMYG